MNSRDTVFTIEALISRIKQFIQERNWEKYHNPKDIAESICIESSELLKLFQWIKPKANEEVKRDSKKMEQIKAELADVVIYCLSMANSLNINLSKAVIEKIELNEKKYPVNIYKGKAHLH